MKKFLTKLLKLFGIYKNREVSYDDSTTSVVIAGVEYSPKWGACPGVLKDCDTMKSIISKSADKYDLVVLKNEQATVSAWKSAVQKAVQKPLAIIYYSGHGGSDKYHSLGKGKNEADGIDEYMCLYDKPLLDDEVWNLISSAKGRVFLIFDCCHSATMFRTAKDSDEELSVGRTNIDIVKLADENRNPDSNVRMLCWSACADNTVAQGASTGGIFTNALKRFFKDSGQTYEELWNKLERSEALKQVELIQRTELGKSFKDEKFCN